MAQRTKAKVKFVKICNSSSLFFIIIGLDAVANALSKCLNLSLPEDHVLGFVVSLSVLFNQTLLLKLFSFVL